VSKCEDRASNIEWLLQQVEVLAWK